MSIKERYFINEYAPKYNKQYNNKSSFSFTIDNVKWEAYTDWNYDDKFIPGIQVKTNLSRHGILEIEKDHRNVKKIIQELKKGNILKINGSHYILINIRNQYCINTYKIEKSLYHKEIHELKQISDKSKRFHLPSYRALWDPAYYKLKKFNIEKEDILILPSGADFLKITAFEKIFNTYSGNSSYEETNGYFKKILKGITA